MHGAVDAAHKAEDEAEGDPADALVWDELITRTREESTLSVTLLLFLTLACLIAAIGVVTDSTVTVVGAMVLGPEFGPLAALSVAVVQRRFELARRALLVLLVGFPVAMGITAVATLAGGGQSRRHHRGRRAGAGVKAPRHVDTPLGADLDHRARDAGVRRL